MSLISIENFMAPFQNKVHLVTIFMVAAVFGILRMQGGSISIESEMGNSRYERKTVKTAPRNGYQANQAKRQNTVTNTNQNSPSSLDEIERSLGLK